MATTSSVPGTNVAPVSFPGIASGIDYNSIITKLTSMSMEPTVALNAQIATLNSANAELIKINGLLASIQTAITGLSQSEIYSAISATSSDPAAATASGIPNVSATPGSYTIDATSLATPTVVTAAANIGHVITDAMPGTTTSGADVPLADSWASVTPTNGTAGGHGVVTIDGVSISYDVNSQSLNTILANINSAVQASGDSTFNIALTGNTVSITDSAHPVSLGSPSDSGNLLQVLHLDAAQVNNTPASGSVTATQGVGGVNIAPGFSSNNALGQATNAGYLTAVTSGSFTINGVQIAVNAAGDNLNSVLQRITASAAGVVASYNSVTGGITLTAKNSGPQSIVLGSSSDTSNFLSATGLTAASGAALQIGTQASVKLQNPTGTTTTVYSNSNDVTTAIPGVSLNLLSATSTPFQVTVGADSSGLVSALNTFVSAYNDAINEINIATMPPVVATGSAASSITGPVAQAVGGGVLYGNSDVSSVKDELINIVAGLNQSTGSAQYNSLSTIGISLTDSFTQLVQNSNAAVGQQIGTQSYAGTDGQLQALDPNALQAAFASNPSAVQNLINGSHGLVQQLGTYLTGVTGFPTNTQTALLGTVPAVSLIQTFENANTSSIQNIQQQITQITNNVNMQADALRTQFTSSEASIAQLQSLQSQLSGFFKSSGG